MFTNFKFPTTESSLTGSRSLRHLIETARERRLIDDWFAEGLCLVFRTGTLTYRVQMGHAAELLTGLNAAYERSEALAAEIHA